MKHTQRLVKAVLISLALALFSPAYADMVISPTRVFMDTDNRSATLILRNSSTGARTYRLSWEDKRAKENGSYAMITDEDEWQYSAQDMIRLSPRQITVGPGENQTVRFSYRPPADLQPGEYRSHLLLKVIPDISEPTASIDTSGPEDNVGVRVFMQMSFSIPVVVRHNTEAPQISISKVKAVPVKKGERLGLELTFNRVGNASSYGRVSVEMQRDADSPVEIIGERGELSIFHELDERTLTIPLREARIPEGALVRVAYEGLKEYKGTLWAEKVFQAE